MPNSSAERRRTDRRFTDSEVEDILELVQTMNSQIKASMDLVGKMNDQITGNYNGQRKRQRVFGITMSTLLGISTLANIWIVTPIKEQIATLGHEVREIDNNVRQHHEDQAALYVSKKDEEEVKRDLRLLTTKIDKIVEYMLDKHGK